MAVILTAEQWSQFNAKLDRILSELMLRQPIDANVQKRLLELEAAVQMLKAAR